MRIGDDMEASLNSLEALLNVKDDDDGVIYWHSAWIDWGHDITDALDDAFGPPP